MTVACRVDVRVYARLGLRPRGGAQGDELHAAQPRTPVLTPTANPSSSGSIVAGVRLQDVYSSSLFPDRPIRITKLSFRPEEGTPPFSGQIPLLRVALSTTSRLPDGRWVTSPTLIDGWVVSLRLVPTAEVRKTEEKAETP